MTTKDLIETILKKTGYSNYKVSKITGESETQIKNWQGGQEMKFSTATKICTALNLNLSDILIKGAKQHALDISHNEALISTTKDK